MSLTLKQREELRRAIDVIREIRGRHDITGPGGDHETYDISMCVDTRELEAILRYDRWNLSHWLKWLAVRVAKS